MQEVGELELARQLYQQALMRTDFDRAAVLSVYFSSIGDELLADVFRSLLLPHKHVVGQYATAAGREAPAPTTAVAPTARKLRECLVQLHLRLELAVRRRADPPSRAERRELLRFAETVSIITEAGQPGDFAWYLDSVLLPGYGERLPRTLRAVYRHFEFAVPPSLVRPGDLENDGFLNGVSVQQRQPLDKPPAVVEPSPSVCDDEPPSADAAKVEDEVHTPVETTRLVSATVSPLLLGHFVAGMNTPRPSLTVKTTLVTKQRQKVRVKRRRTTVVEQQSTVAL